MINKNYITLKASLTDGHYTTEDTLTISCLDIYPSPTPTVSPSSNIIMPTPNNQPATPIPTSTPAPLPNIILDSSNSWTYRSNGFLIAKFLPIDNNSIVIRLVSLPQAFLPQPGQPAPIPSSAIVTVQNNDAGELVFINNYINQNIILNINNSQYSSSINIGQIAFN